MRNAISIKYKSLMDKFQLDDSLFISDEPWAAS